MKKGKNKSHPSDGEEDMEEQEEIEFEQFPQPTNLGEAHACLSFIDELNG